MNPYTFSIFCFGFCSVLIGFFVWLKRSDKIGKIYFLFSASIGGWALFSGICWAFNNTSLEALFYLRIADIFALFIPPTWLHFCLAYTDNSKKIPWLLKISYLSSFSLCLFSFSDLYISRLRMTSLGMAYKEPGIIFIVYTVLFFVMILAGYFLLARKLVQSRGQEKTQLLGFIAAISVGYVGGGLYFLPIYHIEIPQYAIFLMPFYPFVAAYFMIRQKLFDVEELAQAAHRDKLTAIGVLAASINHEVKNPLFIIKGLAESCLERQKEGIFPNKEKALESANDAMKRSIEQADRAMDIIKRLSLFAKAGIDSEIKFEPVKIAQVLDDILPLVRYELAAHNIALTRDIPQNLPEVRADRRYLEEIFFNLVVNALQAIRETGKPGEIRVSAAKGDSPSNAFKGTVPFKDSVTITISDTGPGIPADKLKDVFRPFYTTKAEGTGLGLYITQQLVEKVRGKIDVRSEVGSGTTFAVLLPI